MYNTSLYNEANYNSTHFTADLFESVGATDQETMMSDIVKSDLLTLTEFLFKQLNNNPFLDEAVVTDDDIANFVTKVLSDNQEVVDELKFLSLKALSDSLTISDLRRLLSYKLLNDSVVMVDTLTKQIVNKALSDSITLKDWLSAKKQPPSSEWYD